MSKSRFAFAALLVLLLGDVASADEGARCDSAISRELAPLNQFENQALTVEAFGACDDPKLLIWIDRLEANRAGRVQVIHMARLSVYGSTTFTPAAAESEVAAINARVETDASRYFETWEELERAGEQPDGMPWRGTPLSRADYERIVASGARAMLIPTDGARGTLVAWDDSIEQWVDLIYYGD